MNSDYLRTFLRLVERGSFSEVARELGISQPAVSFQLQKLERELSIRLIDRHQKNITLTSAGKRLLEFARNTTAQESRLFSEIEQLREEVSGELIITASTIPGQVLLPPILGEFKLQHPAVKISVVISDSMTVIAEVLAGKYEVGFCGAEPQKGELEAIKVAEDEIVLIVFPEHPFASREEISLLEIDNEQFISREATSGTQQNIENYFHQAGLHTNKYQPALVLGNTEAVVSAVENKLGIAFVSALAIKKSLALGLVKQVKVSGLTLKRDFFCVYRKGMIVSRLLEEFITFISGNYPHIPTNR